MSTTWLTGSSGACLAMCEVQKGLHSAARRLLPQHSQRVSKSAYKFLGERGMAGNCHWLTLRAVAVGSDWLPRREHALP